MKNNKTIWLKRLLSLVLLLVLIYFFLPMVDEIKSIGDLLQRAAWICLPLAVLVQVISYMFLTWLNVLSLAPFSGKISFFKLAAVLTSMAFIQVAIPSAGVSGIAMRVRLLGKHGYKTEEALFSLVVETIAELIVLACVSLLGVAYLFQTNQFLWYEILFLAISFGCVFGLVWYGWYFVNHEQHSQKVLAKIAQVWNKIIGRFYRHDFNLLSERLVVFQGRLRQYRDIPLWKFALATFGKVILDVVTLGVCFHLFHFPINLGTLFTGYGLILIFSGIAILPGGIGMTDAYVPVIFSWLSVPAAVALAAGLLYRLIAYWLLRFIGFLCWQVLERD